jgi:hypothetical protein
MKLPDLILHNFRLKAFSFLIAVLVWVAMHLMTGRIPRPAAPADPAETGQLDR